MAKQFGEINNAICEALKLDPNDVCSLTIKLSPHGPPVVDVTLLVSSEQGLINVLQHCELLWPATDEVVIG